MNNDFHNVYTPPAFEPKESRYTVGESFFAWFCVLSGYLFCRACPVNRYPVGAFAVILISLITTAVLLARKGAGFGAPSVVSAIACVITGSSLFFSSVGFIQTLGFFCSAFAYVYFVYSASGNRLEVGASDLIAIDFFKALILLPFSCFVRLWVAMFSGKRIGWKFVLKVFIGLMIAVIPTAIVVALLSYDSEFAELFEEVFSFIIDFNIFSHLGSLLLGSVVAMYVFGLYSASASHKLGDAITAEKCHHSASKLHIAPILTVAAALLPLVSVYVIFFVSQFKYYVSAFSGVLPQGINYADYARSGFFELCTVSAINLVILACVAMFMRRGKKSGTVFLKLASVVISLLTLVLIATAASKMILYIKSYGLTERRLEASWFIVLLALIFILIIFKQIFNKLKIVSASAIVTALMLGVLLLSNYNSIIADYNVDKYISGELEGIDEYALYKLGTPAVPALVRLAEYQEAKYGVDIADIANNQDPTAEATEYNETAYYLKRFDNKLNKKKSGITGFNVPDFTARRKLDGFLNKNK